MARRHWMPFCFADYLADTAHLSATEHGAYLLLIAHYWQHDGLPNDESIIARITRMTPRQWSHSRDLLRSFFDDNWRHKRIDREIGKAIDKSRVNSANAQRRHGDRKAEQVPTDTQLTINNYSHKEVVPAQSAEPTPKKEVASRQGSKTRLPDDWKAKQSSIDEGMKLGLKPHEIAREAAKFFNHAKANDRMIVKWDKAFDNWLIQAAEYLGREGISALNGGQLDEKAYRAMPDTPEYNAWKAYYTDKGNRFMVQQLNTRVLEGRPFTFEDRWPPGHGGIQ